MRSTCRYRHRWNAFECVWRRRPDRSPPPTTAAREKIIIITTLTRVHLSASVLRAQTSVADLPLLPVPPPSPVTQFVADSKKNPMVSNWIRLTWLKRLKLPLANGRCRVANERAFNQVVKKGKHHRQTRLYWCQYKRRRMVTSKPYSYQ